MRETRCKIFLVKMDETDRVEDVALILGPDEERKALRVLRKRNHAVEAALVRPVEPERPLMGDLVRLKPRPGIPVLCDVETLYEFRPSSPTDEEATSRSPGHSGPARVTSDAYRRGWDRIFGRRDPGDPDVN